MALPQIRALSEQVLVASPQLIVPPSFDVGDDQWVALKKLEQRRCPRLRVGKAGEDDTTRSQPP